MGVYCSGNLEQLYYKVKSLLPQVGLGPAPALLSSCILMTSFLAEDEENKKARVLSSKHMMLGRMVSQFRKLKLPLIIKIIYKEKNQTSSALIRLVTIKIWQQIQQRLKKVGEAWLKCHLHEIWNAYNLFLIRCDLFSYELALNNYNKMLDEQTLWTLLNPFCFQRSIYIVYLDKMWSIKGQLVFL